MILVHGGAGQIGAERHERLRAGVRAAAESGHAGLGRGASFHGRAPGVRHVIVGFRCAAAA